MYFLPRKKEVNSLTKKKTGLYRPARYKKYAAIVTFNSLTDAGHAAKCLIAEFNAAQTRAKMRRVKAVTVQAANRANTNAKNHTYTPETRKRMSAIALVYEKAYKRMVLPIQSKS